MLLALAGATIFAWNVFSDWQDERTITSLKTISKPVNQLDFPSVTICKGGQNLQAVREVLEGEVEEFSLPGPILFGRFVYQSHLEGEVDEWAKGRREKRSPSGSDYCQLVFHRTCDQVFFYQDLINIDVFFFELVGFI